MEEDEALRRKYRTDCWLEQCIYEDRICAPEEQVAFVPLGIDIPVPGALCTNYYKWARYPLRYPDTAAEDVVLSISGFDQSESHALKRLFRALGKAQNHHQPPQFLILFSQV
jgi:DNA replication regulator DPB11